MSDIRKRYLDRQAAPAEPAEPIETERKPRGRRMTRRNQPRARIPGETALFQAAADLLKLTPCKSNELFGVTRQTMSKWLKGTSAPRLTAFVTLTRLLVEREKSVTVMEKRITEHEQRLSAALQQAEEIRAQLREIKHDVFVKGADA